MYKIIVTKYGKYYFVSIIGYRIIKLFFIFLSDLYILGAIVILILYYVS